MDKPITKFMNMTIEELKKIAEDLSSELEGLATWTKQKTNGTNAEEKQNYYNHIASELTKAHHLVFDAWKILTEL